MEIYSYPYPEVIRRVNEENKFLKSEKKEEKKKSTNTIKVLRFEIEELKEKERLLQVELNEVKSDNKSLTAQLDSERKKTHPD
tara:strand:+ start:319 stop:567 length:249 start_codon:yes stop_codon:yes gene_type:complete